MMPKMDGFTLATLIREQNKKVPIVFLTAKNVKDDMMKRYKSGAYDFHNKPFDSEVLVKKTESIFRRAMSIKKMEEL